MPEHVRKPRALTVVDRKADPQQADLDASEKQKEGEVCERSRDDPQALGRDHNDLDHDPSAQHRDQYADEEAPASTVGGPGEVDRLADGDPIPPPSHDNKSKAIRSFDELPTEQVKA